MHPLQEVPGLMARKRRATLTRMDAVVITLQEGDGLTTQELYESLSEWMNYGQLQAALRHLVRAGDVLQVSNDDWGQVVEMRDGPAHVWPGAGHLYFVDALACSLWVKEPARAA